MHVKIEVEDRQITLKRTEEYASWFTTKTREIEYQVPKHCVLLYVTPTEEERAVVHKFNLLQIEIDAQHLYSPEECEEMHQRSVNAVVLADRQEAQGVYKRMSEATLSFPLEKFFNSPFIMPFDSLRHAYDTIDFLKEKSLPEIKKKIDYYLTRSKPDSFTL